MGRDATTDMSWAKTRRDAARQRRGPRTGARVTISFSSDGEIPSDFLSALVIEPTDCAGEVASWLDDAWWSKLFQRCAPRPLTIEIARTPRSLTNPILLHQLEMVRRIVANWRIIGEGYANEIRSDDDIEQLATGPYHELRLRDGGRPDAAPPTPSESRPGVDELIARIRSRTEGTPYSSPNLVRVGGTDS